MKILFKLQRMEDGSIVVYTNVGDGKWVQHGHWSPDPNVVAFEGFVEIETPR